MTRLVYSLSLSISTLKVRPMHFPPIKISRMGIESGHRSSISAENRGSLDFLGRRINLLTARVCERVCAGGHLNCLIKRAGAKRGNLSVAVCSTGATTRTADRGRATCQLMARSMIRVQTFSMRFNSCHATSGQSGRAHRFFNRRHVGIAAEARVHSSPTFIARIVVEAGSEICGLPVQMLRRFKLR